MRYPAASPPRKAASLMGYVSMAMAVGPMLGPLLGGGLDELFGWRAARRGSPGPPPWPAARR
ncbi:MAG: hypothetical protein U5R46_18455 [Gammaproteobacteria bacterium]|nr:hypothetical protein [Gammaproteobacteria bacterium]